MNMIQTLQNKMSDGHDNIGYEICKVQLSLNLYLTFLGFS